MLIFRVIVLLAAIGCVPVQAAIDVTPPAFLAGYAIGRAEGIATHCKNVRFDPEKAKALRERYSVKAWDQADFERAYKIGKNDASYLAEKDEETKRGGPDDMCDPWHPGHGVAFYQKNEAEFSGLLVYDQASLRKRSHKAWPRELIDMTAPRVANAWTQGWLLGLARALAMKCPNVTINEEQFLDIQDYWSQFAQEDLAAGFWFKNADAENDIRANPKRYCDPKSIGYEFAPGTVRMQVTNLVQVHE